MKLTTSTLAVTAAGALIVAVTAQGATAAPTRSPSARSQSHSLRANVPGFIHRAARVGHAASGQTLHLTVWLKQPNETGVQQLLRGLYTKGSPSYHHWVTPGEFAKRFSPTKADIATVSSYLRSNGFHVGSVPGNRLYVNATGSVAHAERTFGVTIGRFALHGHTYYANTGAPKVTGAASRVISFIGGLDNAPAYTYVGAKPAAAAPKTAVAYDALCGGFNTTKTVSYTDGTSQTLKGFVPCGYNGDQLEKAYNVSTELSAGITGKGQTVAIVDAYGSPTLPQDLKAFAQGSHLYSQYPPNLVQMGPKGTVNKKESKSQDPLGWQPEVTLDAEAVYSMAPQAKILVVAAPNNYADLDQAVNEVVVKHLANIVTNSWGYDTDIGPSGQANRDERIFEQAAAEGIGVGFSSGDSGDELAATGTKSVDWPASSPWVTSVGGTSLFVNSDNTYNFETGWGNELTRLATCASSVTDPTTGHQACQTYDKAGYLQYGFTGGSGGGLSYLWTGQPWQQSAIGGDTAAGFGTVGTHRAVPDVGMVADPYTGMNVYITDLSAGDTSPEIEPYGGTSLSSPLFAGMMALVDQSRANAGEGATGLATPYLYPLIGSAALHDVSTPPAGVGNPNGDPTSFDLYYGSRYSGSLFTASFNQDSSLATGPGWDDVTGVGSPDAPAFVAALTANQ